MMVVMGITTGLPLNSSVARSRQLHADPGLSVDRHHVPVVVGIDGPTEHARPEAALGCEIGGDEHHDLEADLPPDIVACGIGTTRDRARRRPHRSTTLARVRVERLSAEDVVLMGLIDRAEHVDRQYQVVDGRLVDAPVFRADIPSWDPDGDAAHSVARHIELCADAVGAGAALFGAFDGETLLGLATVDPRLEPGLAWLATLHVSRPHRRRGAASALWSAAIDHGRKAGAQSIYVSATPTGSAVGFYLRQGCGLADPVHPRLFAAEPDDVHLVCSI